MEENINPISQEGVKVSLYSKTFLWMFLSTLVLQKIL